MFQLFQTYCTRESLEPPTASHADSCFSRGNDITVSSEQREGEGIAPSSVPLAMSRAPVVALRSIHCSSRQPTYSMYT